MVVAPEAKPLRPLIGGPPPGRGKTSHRSSWTIRGRLVEEVLAGLAVDRSGRALNRSHASAGAGRARARRR